MKKLFIFLAAFYIFGGTVFAQHRELVWVGEFAGSTKAGVSDELLNDYSATISKYADRQNWQSNFEATLSAADRERLEQIFMQMNKMQQQKQQVVFLKANKPLKKIVPTEAQFNSWKNAAVYGVWIDGKKVSNQHLGKYNNKDFAQVFVSRLYGFAKKNKTHTHQVDLMTKAYYQRYYDLTVNNQKNQLKFRY